MNSTRDISFKDINAVEELSNHFLCVCVSCCSVKWNFQLHFICTSNSSTIIALKAMILSIVKMNFRLSVAHFKFNRFWLNKRFYSSKTNHIVVKKTAVIPWNKCRMNHFVKKIILSIRYRCGSITCTNWNN